MDGWPSVERPADVGVPSFGVVRRAVQAGAAIVGVQVLAVGIALLVITSYRRAAAGWLLPLVGVVDALVTLQIGWLAVRDIRLAGRRTVGVRVFLVLLVVALLGGAGVGALAVYRYVNRPAEGVFGSPVMDRDIRFTATEFRCGGKIKRVTVRGTLCRVKLNVANTGSAKVLVEAKVQRLRDEGDEYPGLLLIEGRRRGTAWGVEAGAEVRGVLVFDVPRGSVLRSLEVHADGESRGVRLPVPAELPRPGKS
ncbi:DUF4352 domain-containing protein [Actinomadura meridiana]|uniref:DUF4352 domain-containing protein n=1 Tax=Actinomadura meridiana TaxID=559626 RepID=UPI0031E730A2